MMVGKFSVEVIEEREKKGYIIREMVITKVCETILFNECVHNVYFWGIRYI